MKNTKKELWVLPTIALKLVRNLIATKTETTESFKTKREYIKTREAFPAAIYTLRKILISGDLWYLRKNDIENSSDDIYSIRFDFSGKTICGGPIIPIQVMRITKNSPSKIVDSIKIKFTDDLKGVSLVCHFLRDETIRWQEIFKEIKKIKPNLIDITLIGNIGGSKFIVGQIYPTLQITTVNVDIIKINAPEMIETMEVFKPQDTYISHQGKAFLDTQFNISPLK